MIATKLVTDGTRGSNLWCILSLITKLASWQISILLWILMIWWCLELSCIALSSLIRIFSCMTFICYIWPLPICLLNIMIGCGIDWHLWLQNGAFDGMCKWVYILDLFMNPNVLALGGCCSYLKSVLSNLSHGFISWATLCRCSYLNAWNPHCMWYVNIGSGNGLVPSGGRLNKKDGLTRCGDSHVKDKTS